MNWREFIKQVGVLAEKDGKMQNFTASISHRHRDGFFGEVYNATVTLGDERQIVSAAGLSPYLVLDELADQIALWSQPVDVVDGIEYFKDGA